MKNKRGGTWKTWGKPSDCDAHLTPVKEEREGRQTRQEEPQTVVQ